MNGIVCGASTTETCFAYVSWDVNDSFTLPVPCNSTMLPFQDTLNLFHKEWKGNRTAVCLLMNFTANCSSLITSRKAKDNVPTPPQHPEKLFLSSLAHLSSPAPASTFKLHGSSFHFLWLLQLLPLLPARISSTGQGTLKARHLLQAIQELLRKSWKFTQSPLFLTPRAQG